MNKNVKVIARITLAAGWFFFATRTTVVVNRDAQDNATSSSTFVTTNPSPVFPSVGACVAAAKVLQPSVTLRTKEWNVSPCISLHDGEGTVTND